MLGALIVLPLLLQESSAAATPPVEGIAARYPLDAGIARDPAVLYASGFEDGFDGWTRVNRKIAVLHEDAAQAHGGTRFLRETATRGSDTGGEISWRAKQGVDLLHLRFYCRFAADACWPHHFVKIRALKDGFDGRAGLAPPGDMGFWTGIEPLRGRWRFYTYWHRMRGFNNPVGDGARNDDGTENTGENDWYGNSFTPDGQDEVPRGRWICVEAMVKANTPGTSDGEQAFWIDGVKVGHYRPGEPRGAWRRNVWTTSGKDLREPGPFPGFDFRSSDELKLNEIALQWYVSEEYAAKGAATANIVDFDDVVVARSYIGPVAPAKRP